MSDKEIAGNAPENSKSKLNELLGDCSNFYCKHFDCAGEYRLNCKDFAKQLKM